VEPPVLTCPEAPSDTGAYRLSWKGPKGVRYRLTEDGEILYQGPDVASTVSGREEGSYTYRVGLIDEAPEATGRVAAWSEPCRVEVAPPSLPLAFGLLGMGFVVFLFVLVIIVRGHRAHRRGELG
jgi:hypothetical protein